MPRQPRAEVAGGIYHVFARGAAKQTIFHDNRDRRRYLATCWRVIDRMSWSCLGYCLLGNHMHLLIETADFFGGLFKLRKAGRHVELRLSQKLTGCPKARSGGANAAQSKPKSRRLWGDGRGKFRTRGKYSSATVRGTRWLVQDTCTLTLTRVTQGVVTVKDFAKKKTVRVKANKRYIARPKRR